MYSENPNPLDLNSATLPAHQIPLRKRLPYFIGKAGNFFIRYRNNLPYLFKYVTSIHQGAYKEQVTFMSDEEFVEAAKSRSTLRLQDGEFTLLLGTRDLAYEKKNTQLTSMWMEAIENYSDTAPYILGLPPYVVIDNRTLHKEGFKYLWMPAKILYSMWFPKKPKYFNGSYFYIDNTSIPFMQALSDQKDVLLVSNAEVIRQTQPHSAYFFKHARSFSSIETPEKNTFEVYDATIKNIEKYITPHTVIFMACGPAGKAMIYDLSKKGILAHDIGHGLTGAYTKESREHFLKWDIFGPLYYATIKK